MLLGCHIPLGPKKKLLQNKETGKIQVNKYLTKYLQNLVNRNMIQVIIYKV